LKESTPVLGFQLQQSVPNSSDIVLELLLNLLSGGLLCCRCGKTSLHFYADIID